MAKAEAFVDGWLAKLTSRKLMVWVTATVLTFSGTRNQRRLGNYIGNLYWRADNHRWDRETKGV